MDDAIKTALDELILQAGLAEGRGVDLDPHHREAVVEAVSAAIASAGNEGFVSGRKAGRLEGALAVAKRLSPHASPIALLTIAVGCTRPLEEGL